MVCDRCVPTGRRARGGAHSDRGRRVTTAWPWGDRGRPETDGWHAYEDALGEKEARQCERNAVPFEVLGRWPLVLRLHGVDEA